MAQVKVGRRWIAAELDAQLAPGLGRVFELLLQLFNRDYIDGSLGQEF